MYKPLADQQFQASVAVLSRQWHCASKTLYFQLCVYNSTILVLNAGGTGPVVADSDGGGQYPTVDVLRRDDGSDKSCIFSLYQHFYTTGGKYEKAVIIVVLGNISRD